MQLKHLIVYFLLNSALSVCGSMNKKTFAPNKAQQLLETVVNLTDSLMELTPYLNSTLAEIPSNCVQILCKFVCFNGFAADIEVDILTASQKNNYFCSHIEELRLYNYIFPGGKLSLGFLGQFCDKVKILYLASMNITDIESGVFANGIFKEIHFENLQLRELKGDFFEGIKYGFDTLSIIQKQMPIERANVDFLYNIKYLIKNLRIQAGLKSISNLTGADFLLSNLVQADFSYNDLSSEMEMGALGGACRLEWLDLSNCNLERIPAYLFAGFITSLEHLDLSHNKLKTISRDMFGWREIPHDLKIYADNNRWSCSCDLQQEIRFINLHCKSPLVCTEPAKYQGFSLFDDEICGTTIVPLERETSKEEDDYRISTILEEEENEYIHIPGQTTQLPEKKASSVLPSNLMQLHCNTNISNRHKTTDHFLYKPLIAFTLAARESHRVEVNIAQSSQQPSDAFALLWFSKVTSQFYKMEINYNEYGLGCYKNISAVTSVSGLKPNTAYTFCVVSQRQFLLSPFNCQSIYVGNNLAVKNTAWLTQDMKITGLVLFIFGIVMFLVAGMLMMCLLLKHKCISLKKSRIAKNADGRKAEKSLRPSKEQKAKFARCGQFTFFSRRRNSTVSEISYESYINANIYEVIPAVLEELNTKTTAPADETSLADCPNQDTDSFYLTPLQSIPSSGNFIQYADIPHLSKRHSHVLPQLPAEVATALLSPKGDYAQIGNVYFLDSHV